ncbi:hypothetical protein ATANTOWER_013460 [Ataeniobius toweri]|uniref:Uncharacterized protein n=1 Tax=Ataeniobius toweri TaxID=208326 RepID=A0ABU7A718_9TELE|nr:hypothetical protein [Ataeniobius toweri]
MMWMLLLSKEDSKLAVFSISEEASDCSLYRVVADSDAPALDNPTWFWFFFLLAVKIPWITRCGEPHQESTNLVHNEPIPKATRSCPVIAHKCILNKLVKIFSVSTVCCSRVSRFKV